MAINYDIAGLAKELEADYETLLGLYASYFEEMKEEIASMEAHLVKGDLYMLERVVHNIKGVSINLGITDVFSEAEKFDILLKQNISENAQNYVKSITNLIQDAEETVRSFFLEQGLQL